MKLWKVTERDKQPSGFNLKDDSGLLRDPTSITTLRVPIFRSALDLVKYLNTVVIKQAMILWLLAVFV